MTHWQQLLAQAPVIAILRGITPAEVEDAAEALFAHGIRLVEVPLNSPDPLASIAKLAARFAGRMITGAGTVQSVADVRAVADAGGQLIISPHTDPAVIAAARAARLIPLPGFATATEAFTAIQAGAAGLKLFPASTYGPSHLKALSAVLPQDVPVLAVGGVGPGDLAAWRAAGASGFGIGGELYRPGDSATVIGQKAAAFQAALAKG